MDQFTEGLTYCQINIPRGFIINSISGIIVTPSSGGSQFDFRNASRFYRALNQGIQTSLANANLIDKFVMSDRHTSGSSAIFKRYYMIVYFGTNLHIEFTDDSDTRKSYCKGAITSLATRWIDSDNLNFIVRINLTSVW